MRIVLSDSPDETYRQTFQQWKEIVGPTDARQLASLAREYVKAIRQIDKKYQQGEKNPDRLRGVEEMEESAEELRDRLESLYYQLWDVGERGQEEHEVFMTEEWDRGVSLQDQLIMFWERSPTNPDKTYYGFDSKREWLDTIRNYLEEIGWKMGGLKEGITDQQIEDAVMDAVHHKKQTIDLFRSKGPVPPPKPWEEAEKELQMRGIFRWSARNHKRKSWKSSGYAGTAASRGAGSRDAASASPPRGPQSARSTTVEGLAGDSLLPTDRERRHIASELKAIAGELDAMSREAGLMSIRVKLSARVDGKDTVLEENSFNLPMRVKGYIKKLKDKYDLTGSWSANVDVKHKRGEMMSLTERVLRWWTDASIFNMDYLFKRFLFDFMLTFTGFRGLYKGREVDFTMTYVLIDVPFSKLPNVFQNLGLEGETLTKVARKLLPYLETAMYKKQEIDIKEKLTADHVERYLKGEEVAASEFLEHGELSMAGT